MENYSTETLQEMGWAYDDRIQDYRLTPEKRERAREMRDQINEELRRRGML
jgi:hypothetical protein